jgi:putative ABC transport system permease protein
MLKNYLKIAYKVLLRRKFYTFISLFGICFTMMVLMVGVALFDEVFGARSPEIKSDRMRSVYFIEFARTKNRGVTNGPPGYRFLDRYVRTLETPEMVSVHSVPRSAFSYLAGKPVESYLKRTDGEFWEILDFKFLEGGPLTREDEENRNFVAVINSSTRRKFFGGEPATGKFFEVDGQKFRVVGVVEDVPFYRLTPFADIWVPISTAKTDTYKEQILGLFFAIVLASSPADLDRIDAEFQAMLPKVELPDPDKYDHVVSNLDTLLSLVARLVFRGEDAHTDTGRLMGRLLTLAVLFMILPAINLININVSRIMERASEIGVRKSFGASSWTLVGQFVIENVMLTLIGGLLGFFCSFAILHLIAQEGFIPYAEFSLNYRVFLVGMVMATFFGLLSGVYPAWRMSRLHPVDALRGGSR